MKTILTFLLILPVFAFAKEKYKKEGIKPGQELKYGNKLFKWEADTNGNEVIDLDEVLYSDNGNWRKLNENDEKDTHLFEETIMYRRQLRFVESDAFIYKSTPNRDLALFVDYPSDWKKSDQRVAIIWYYGGAWSSGNILHFKPQAEYFTQRGIVNIRVDYRVVQRDGISDGGYTSAQDAKTALRWVKRNAKLLGVDPDKIIVGGGSAGGHLALATQLKSVDDPNDDLSINTDVIGFILHNPYVVYLNEKSYVFNLDYSKLAPVWVAYGLKDIAAYNDDTSQKRTERNGESFVKLLAEKNKGSFAFIKENGGHGFCSSPQFLEESTHSTDQFLQTLGVLDDQMGKVTSKAQWFLKIERRKQIISDHTLRLTKYRKGQSVNSFSSDHSK
ncbi:alpha/beta hydrolase [Flammeovirga sp. EKP202]|uniref:alpha/beta hydrolase n=1 Tax=Flammeovirga sp. EKP202 TaxID=2770592 RepID=UPI00165F2D55|nr:alpha/beta hydrolase [Flammeovirga sp. EKP202]MBD0400262.1 alpha/beta hydrolase [Flammeovirga sp. EKP202]